ncbi:14917_t:CDS:2 [Dentiscutata erythropus]|uniref:14917_t:CDS:1 n=1 Tax=Dentiscutata erythropus TaxID=1348616 RepID=A0A9N9I524_9GLOM|nr:14917_t:CDS:2 [Dentiscutata erythropus]
MPTCSTCAGNFSLEEFIYKDNDYDTCNCCKISRAKKRNAKKNKLLDDSNPEQMFIEIISLQEDTISDIDANVRIMAKLIIDEIEEGNNYN